MCSSDLVMAVFNFPVQHPDHAVRAVRAARALQADCRARFAAFARNHGIDEGLLGVGIGIDSGAMKFGEFGPSHRDLTAIGTTIGRRGVNIAARAQSAAPPGGILVTGRVRERAADLAWPGDSRAYPLKGLDRPVQLHAA